MRYEIRGRVLDSFSVTASAAYGSRPGTRTFGLDDYLGRPPPSTTARSRSVSTTPRFADLLRQLARPVLQGLLLQRAACLNRGHGAVECPAAADRRHDQGAAPEAAACDERHIYLKIERIEDYSPVKPQDKVVPPVQYGRDCMRIHGHENGLIPQAEIDARVADRRRLPRISRFRLSGSQAGQADRCRRQRAAYMHRVPGPSSTRARASG